jgi:HEPN domain-containing protein
MLRIAKDYEELARRAERRLKQAEKSSNRGGQ